MAKPRFLDDPAFKALRSGEIDAFHRAIQGRQVVDLSGADLRAVDFRGADLSKVVFRDAYLREADLRGCDLRRLDLTGCSLYHAKVSGAYLPEDLSAAEIRMSLECGTRIRAGQGSRSA